MGGRLNGIEHYQGVQLTCWAPFSLSHLLRCIKEDDVVGAPSVNKDPPHFRIDDVSGDDGDIIVWHFDFLADYIWEDYLLSFEMLRMMMGGIHHIVIFLPGRIAATSCSQASRCSRPEFRSYHKNGRTCYLCQEALDLLLIQIHMYKPFLTCFSRWGS